MVKSDDGRNIPVVQAFAFGKYLGYLKVIFNNAGDVIKAEGNPILLDKSIPQGRPIWCVKYIPMCTRFCLILCVFVFFFLVLWSPSSWLSDPDILTDINRWKKDLAQYSSQYVGETLVYLNGTFEECRFRECNLGNLICDAMVAMISFSPLPYIQNSFLLICIRWEFKER